MRPFLVTFLLVWISFLCLALDDIGTKCPRDLVEALDLLVENWSNKDLDYFSALPEDSAVTRYHESIGLWIRNSWLNSSSCKELRAYWIEKGIKGVDDMSGLMLRGLHRRLNGIERDLSIETQAIVELDRKVHACEMKRRQTAVDFTSHVRIGDVVVVEMKRVLYGNGFNSVVASCSSHATAYDLVNTRLTGTVVRVYDLGDSTFPFLELKLENLGPTGNERILMKKVKIGTTISVPLVGVFVSIIKRNNNDN